MIASAPRKVAPPAKRPDALHPPVPLVLRHKLRHAALSFTTTPAILRLALGGTWALCVVTLLAAYVGIERHRHEMQAIGKDSAPSIIAAQEIRTSLADMQVDVARELLSATDASRAPAEAYEQRRHEAATSLVTAAENITYGNAERVPIRTMVFASGTFEQDVARARVLHARRDPGFLPQLRDADRVLHEELLPAADALDKANLDALDQAYDFERFSAGLGTAAFIAAALALLLVLIGTQVFLFRRMRRVFNLPLFGASLLLVWLLIWLVANFMTESHELKVVKEDCFDSIHALSRARSYAYDARGSQLLRLLDSQRADVLGTGFSDNTAKLVKLDAGATLESIVQGAESSGGASGFTGCLADELHNITFEGEREAAVDTLRGFAEYLAASTVEAQLAGAADTRAVGLALSDSANISDGGATTAAGGLPMRGCGYAFDKFDTALGRTLAINQREFDAALERGMAALESRVATSVAIMAAVIILTYLGFRPRLREYAT